MRTRDVGGPFSEFDFLDRKQPRRFGIADYLLWVARIDPGRVRRVPSQAIGEVGVDENGQDYAFVECPCGAKPVVMGTLEKCECERHYVLIDDSVFVAYGAMAQPN